MREFRGAAIGVAAAIVAFFVMLGALIVVLGWIGFSIYAVVKWIGGAPKDANPVVIVLMLAGLVTLLTASLLALLALVGRSMTPRKRDRAAFGEPEIHGL
ncbi:MAG TPA: hypothetical protein VIB62_05830 [Actinomycetota bacterium]|jgi:hypothetical protein